jgi:hypothetical protein
LICAAESTGDAGAALGTPWAGGVGGGFGRLELPPELGGGAKLGGGFGRFDPLRPNGGGRIDAGGAKLGGGGAVGGGGRPTGTEVTAAMPPMLVIDGTPPLCAIANTEPRVTEFAPLLLPSLSGLMYFVESERGNSFVCLGDGIFSDGRIKGIEDPDPGGGGPVGGGGAPGGGGGGALIPTSSRGLELELELVATRSIDVECAVCGALRFE